MNKGFRGATVLAFWWLTFVFTAKAASMDNYTINVAQSVAVGMAQERVSGVLS